MGYTCDYAYHQLYTTDMIEGGMYTKEREYELQM